MNNFSFFLQRQVCQITVCPCSNTKSNQQNKKTNSSSLSKKNKRRLHRLLSQIGQQNKITNESPCLSLMQRTENGSTSIRFVQIRLSCLCNKNKSNGSYSGKFIRNTTKNSVDPLEVPFGHNVCRSGIRIRWNIIIRMSQNFWVKRYQESPSCSQNQSSSQIFGIKIGIKVHEVSLRLNSLRICRSILMLSSKVNQAQSCLLERKKIVKAIKAIQSRIIDREAAPQPTNNSCSHKRESTCQTCNNCSSPLTHLTPRQYVTNKGSQNHNQQNNNTNLPNKFTRGCVTCVIKTTKQMHINNNKKKTSSICMQITQQPSVRNVSHQVLNTVKCQVYMCCIMHCQKNTSQNLQNQTQPSLNSPIIISVQIRRSWVTNQMILYDSQHWLIPQTSTQFFIRISHLYNKKRKKMKHFLEFEQLLFGNPRSVVQRRHNREQQLDASKSKQQLQSLQPRATSSRESTNLGAHHTKTSPNSQQEKFFLQKNSKKNNKEALSLFLHFLSKDFEEKLATHEQGQKTEVATRPRKFFFPNKKTEHPQQDKFLVGVPKFQQKEYPKA